MKRNNIQLLMTILLLAGTLVFSSCGGGSQKDSSEDKEKSEAQKEEKEQKNKKDKEDKKEKMKKDKKVVDKTGEGDEVSITVKTPGENMQDMRYNVDVIKIKKGQKVKLTLNNVAESQAMQHNFVVVKEENAKKVANEGMKNPDNGYLPKGKKNVLAATKMAKPGDKVEAEFTIEEKGTYKFICTYPGHYPNMTGTIKVQ